MKILDKQYVKTPFYGIDKMTRWLGRQGHFVNVKRVRRLMRQMGLEAVYPRSKRGLSISDKQHKKYPYLLKGVQITRPDQVVNRYNLHSNVSRLGLSYCCDGLVQQIRFVLASISNP